MASSLGLPGIEPIGSQLWYAFHNPILYMNDCRQKERKKDDSDIATGVNKVRIRASQCKVTRLSTIPA